ncbi:MAG: alpha/beta hydrolase [Acidobacteriaceae bacterium]|nr:alpha/beta hydrolase [Acidobacteriaceae bacterium]
MSRSSWGLLLCSLFSMAALINAAGPRASTETHRAERKTDIEYANVAGVSLRLDASIPQDAKAAPAVIIVHGGGWVAGNRRVDVAPLFTPLTDAGFAWFSIDYRLATDVTQFGIAIEDVESAVRFVKTHASEFHVDPNRIALIGESAGGQLAAMAALRAGPDASVRAVAALYAPSDLVALLKNSNYVPAQIRESVVGTPWERMILAGLSGLSPIDNVRPDMPPFLLIHGTADPLVPFEQSTAMCSRMRQAGASCQIYPVQGAGHGIRWWETNSDIRTAYKEKLIQWLNAELGILAAVRS